MPTLSLILNVYNEEKNISSVFEEITKILNKAKIIYEIIFVEGGSTDNSFKILKRLETKNIKNVRVFKGEISPGSKLMLGFKKAKGKYVCFMCSDGQDNPTIIPMCIKLLEENSADFVKGGRISRQYLQRLVISRIYNFVVRAMFGIHSIDINGHPKVFSRRFLPLLELKSKNESIDLEIMLKAKMLGLKMVEIIVAERKRNEGGSSVGIKVIYKFIYDILSFKWGKNSREILQKKTFQKKLLSKQLI